MSEADKIAESVNKIAEAFSGLSEGAKLRDEVARLKAKSAMQGGEVAKLLAEKANLKAAKKKISEDLDQLRKEAREGSAKLRAENDELKARAAKDADFIEELYERIDAANGVAENFKKAAEDLSKKLWDQHGRAMELEGDIKELREQAEEWSQANRRNAKERYDLYDRLRQGEDAVRDALEAITGKDAGGDPF